jgi:hypothetical protein
MLKFTFPIAVGAFIACFNSQAATINFSTALPLGNLSDSVSIGGVTATGWDVSKTNNAIWSDDGVILNNRHETPDDLGLGVCFRSDCPPTGNGDINEIDNNGPDFEVIRLDFGSPTFVNSIGLSSLDSGLKDGFAIFGSNTAQPTISSLTAIASGTNTSEGTITPIIPIDESYRYFFVTSLKRGVNDSGSDFLLESVTTTPEPYTSATLGLGLLAIAAALRLKTRNLDSK